MSLEIIIHWHDEDIVEVRAVSSNGRFSGSAYCYANHDVFQDFANAIRGFPTSDNDDRSFTIGSFDPQNAGGGFRIHLRCVDLARHITCDVHLRNREGACKGSIAETAEFSFPVESMAIERFALALDRMKIEGNETAILERAI